MAKVVSLSKGPVAQDRRAEFLRLVAQAYDEYSQEEGSPPAGMFTVFNGLGGASTFAFLVVSEGEGKTRLLLSQAAMRVQAACVENYLDLV